MLSAYATRQINCFFLPPFSLPLFRPQSVRTSGGPVLINKQVELRLQNRCSNAGVLLTIFQLLIMVVYIRISSSKFQTLTVIHIQGGDCDTET